MELINPKTRRKVRKIEWLALVILLISAILSFIALDALADQSGLLSVYFLDVGQGDSIFIESPTGNQILIDGGPDDRVVDQLSKIMPFYDNTIDAIILTHPHADHVNGLISVLKKYQVGRILENDVPYDSASKKEWDSLKNASQVIEAQSGQVLDIGGGADIEILYPDTPGLRSGEKESKNVHDYMVVSRLDYQGQGLLLTGDMEAKLEDKLINQGLPLKADFLKVGHHGSKTSTSSEFLKTVQPKLAFISVAAKNRYGHPYPATLSRLENYGIKYYRTDTDGTIKLTLDGEEYSVVSHFAD